MRTSSALYIDLNDHIRCGDLDHSQKKDKLDILVKADIFRKLLVLSRNINWNVQVTLMKITSI